MQSPIDPSVQPSANSRGGRGVRFFGAAAVSLLLCGVLTPSMAEGAATGGQGGNLEHQMTMNDATGDVVTPAGADVPAQYRDLPDITALEVEALRRAVRVRWHMVEVIRPDGSHSQTVSMDSMVSGNVRVQVFADLVGGPVLAVNGNPACAGQTKAGKPLVRQSFRPASDTVVVRFSKSCLTLSARTMYGFMGAAYASYFGVVDGEQTRSGDGGSDVVQSVYPPEIALR